MEKRYYELFQEKLLGYEKEYNYILTKYPKLLPRNLSAYASLADLFWYVKEGNVKRDDSEHWRLIIATLNLMIFQLFTELYCDYVISACFDDIDLSDVSYILDIKTPEEIIDLYLQPSVVQKSFELVDLYQKAAALIRVARVKALSPEQYAFISYINPLFIEEYEHYNVPIDEDFVMRQLRKMQKLDREEEKSYSDMAQFLHFIARICPDEYRSLMSTITENQELISSAKPNKEKLMQVLKDYYLAHKDAKTPTKKLS